MSDLCLEYSINVTNRLWIFCYIISDRFKWNNFFLYLVIALWHTAEIEQNVRNINKFCKLYTVALWEPSVCIKGLREIKYSVSDFDSHDKYFPWHKYTKLNVNRNLISGPYNLYVLLFLQFIFVFHKFIYIRNTICYTLYSHAGIFTLILIWVEVIYETWETVKHIFQTPFHFRSKYFNKTSLRKLS